MDQLRFPDIAGNFQQGYAFGNQVKQQRQAEADQNALRGLAPQIIAGDAAAFEQAAAIDPNAAQTLQGAGDGQLRRLKGAIDYFEQGLQSGNDQLIQARFREISPFLSKLTGQPGPGAWTEEMRPAFEQVKTKIAMAAQGGVADSIQSQKISDDGFIVNTYRSGRMEKTGQKVDRQAWFRDQPGLDPTIVNKDGTVITPGGSPASAAPAPAGATVFRTSNGELFDVSQVTEPAMRAEIMSNPSAYGLLSDQGGGSVELPKRDLSPQQFGGSGLQARPAISPAEQQRLSIAQQANQRAADAAANAQRGNAPAGFRFKADGSLEPIPGGPKPAGAAATEGERKAATLLSRLAFSQSQLEEAVKSDPTAASPNVAASVAGAMPMVGQAAANSINSPARQRVEAAQLDILDAALTLGTGAAYTREQLEGYRRSYFPQIGDSEATIQDKAARLANVIEAAKIAAGRAGPQGGASQTAGAPIPVRTAADYESVPSGAEYMAPDGSVRRKR